MSNTCPICFKTRDIDCFSTNGAYGVCDYCITQCNCGEMIYTYNEILSEKCVGCSEEMDLSGYDHDTVEG
jgi:hypothetical protein